MKKAKYLFWALLVCFCQTISAQTDDIPTGTWRSHYDYSKGNTFCIANNTIFFAAETGMYSYNLATNETEILSEKNGLSSLVVSQIAFDKASNQLLIYYVNGALDFAKISGTGEIEDVFTNESIKKNNSIITAKTANQMTVNEGLGYLATDFGLVIIDIKNRIINEVARNLGPSGIDIEIQSVLIDNGKIILSTSNEILLAKLDNTNLQNFENWSRIPLPPNNLLKNNLLFHFQNNYVHLPKKGFYLIENEKLTLVSPSQLEVSNTLVSGTNLYLATKNGIYQSNGTALLVKTYNTDIKIDETKYILENAGVIFAATATQGLVAISNNTVKIFDVKSSKAILQTRNDESVKDIIGNVWLKLGVDQGVKVTSAKGISKTFGNIPLNDADFSRTSQTVNSLAIDKNGLVFIGTSLGVVAINTDENVVNASDLNAYIITPRINSTRILQNELVNAIAIDGGNRKWFGTSTGLYLYNADVSALLQKFTIDNAPLPNNEIDFLNIDGKSGEIYVYTPSGIVSYRADATEASALQENSVLVFPNPIRPNFAGVLTINGLVANALVKITDINGRIIYQTQANGGTATWNLLIYNGNRAATGIYYIMSSNELGQEKLVSKFAVVN